MKIAISGTHCTGKSTLIDILKKDEDLKNFVFLKSSTRDVLQYGLTINEQGSSLGQLYMVSQDYINLIQNKNRNIISDRCILDTLIYTQYLCSEQRVSSDIVQCINTFFEEVISWYDKIFIIRPEFDIISDGVRSTNNQYRDDIDQLFQLMINNKNHSQSKLQKEFLSKISYLTGTVEQRISQIKSYINE